MKNGCNELLESKIVERSERAKKIYRYVSDVSRRLGDATLNSQSISDLFRNDIEVQRYKLRDNCEKLFFLDPINYGKKALELVWRKVYYDTVCTAKKLRENDNEYDNCLLTHIVCGIGHFHNFITRIQFEMNIEMKELDFSPVCDDEEVERSSNEIPTEEENQQGRSALYSCLIYLGDLSRYQVEIFGCFDPSIAARYYLQATQFDLSLGMPFNQLGNLYLDKNYNLDSVCCYIHCLNCANPFEGAMGNLTKIFEKNNQVCENLQESESLTQIEHMQSTVANFLNLIEIWYFGKDAINIPKLCNTVAQQFKIAMEFSKNPLPDKNKNYNEYVQALDEENANPSYLNSNMIHNIAQICLFTIAKLVETDEVKAFACKAFTLAFFSQILQNCLKQLQLLGLNNPASKYKSKNLNLNISETEKNNEPIKLCENGPMPIANGNIEKDEKNTQNNDILDTETKDTPNGDQKCNKKAITKRRRRRRLNSSESSDLSDADTQSSEIETESSYSNDAEMSDSTYESDDESNSEGSIDDDTDHENNKINGITTEHSKDETEVKKGDDVKLDENPNHINNLGTVDKSHEEAKEFNINGIQEFLRGNNILPSIKLLHDWVLTEKGLILSCGESGESLFQCVVDLTNILMHNFNSKSTEMLKKEDCEILKYAKTTAKKLKLEFKTIPLPEDVKLRGTSICKFDKDAAEWQILEKMKTSIYEENIIRILNFIDFGNQIAKIVPRIRYNRTMKVFFLKKVLPSKVTTKLNHKRNREWHNSKRQGESGEGGLLRRLGRLWLASQVRELERTGQTAVPTLLALDSAALDKHLRRVKQLLRARNFIFLVPTVVLQELDDLKRERSSARDAIRWLEVQLKSGSRFVRTQRPGQSRPLPLLKYPRKAPPHVHNFIQILEFCNHFIADEKHSQGGNGDPDCTLHGKSTPLLILLVGTEPGKSEEHYKEFSLTGAAQSASITVEHIETFYIKWRQTTHKSGKKR